jgi:hypothetical protein
MVEDVGITSLAFIAVSAFAFAWMVRLGFQVRKSIRDHSSHLHDRIDELEDAAVEIRNDLEKVSDDLKDKVDDDYVEKRISGLVQLVSGK